MTVIYVDTLFLLNGLIDYLLLLGAARLAGEPLRRLRFLAGAVLVETVFAIPGLGKYIIDSVNFKDYPVVQGGVLWIGLNCIVINLLVDIIYCFIDPRIRSMYSSKKKVAQAQTGGEENG